MERACAPFKWIKTADEILPHARMVKRLQRPNTRSAIPSRDHLRNAQAWTQARPDEIIQLGLNSDTLIHQTGTNAELARHTVRRMLDTYINKLPMAHLASSIDVAIADELGEEIGAR